MNDLEYIIKTLEYSHYSKYVKYSEGQPLRPTKEQILERELKSQGYLHAIDTLKEMLIHRNKQTNP